MTDGSQPAEGDARTPGVGRRIPVIVAGVVSLVIFLAAVAGWGTLHYFDHHVSHVALRFPAGYTRPPAPVRGEHNLLLIGSDSRAGTSGAFGDVAGQRSDTTILAHIAADGTTTVVSFPRDLWVLIPAYTDTAGHAQPAAHAKLNAAFSLGGPSLLVRTIEGLTRVRVDHYVQIDFIGFQKMTDALGGVTVCVKPLSASLTAQGFNNLADRYSGWQGVVGRNTLTGQRALSFVRQRYGLPQGDINRIQRQQQFLSAVFHKVTAASTLVNPIKVVSVMNAATSSLTVDNGTSLEDLRTLATGLQGGGIRFTTVPTSLATRGAQSVLLYDPTTLTPFLRGIFGPAAGAPPSAAGRATLTEHGGGTSAALTTTGSATTAYTTTGFTTTAYTSRTVAASAPAGSASSCTY
ncbi:MAG: LCP family protein [Frankia sp.]